MTDLTIDHHHLRRSRLAAGISTRTVAEHLGTSRPWLAHLEAGSPHPNLTIDHINRLAHLLHTDPTTLLTTRPAATTTIDDDPGRRPRHPLRTASLRHLHDALTGTLTPAASTNPVIHLQHLHTAGLLNLNTPPDGPTTYQVADTVTYALDRPTAPTRRLHQPQRPHSTCRQELLAAAERLHQTGAATFSAAELANEAIRAGSHYKPSSLRVYINQHLASPITDPTRQLHADLQRVKPGRYQLTPSPDHPAPLTTAHTEPASHDNDRDRSRKRS